MTTSNPHPVVCCACGKHKPGTPEVIDGRYVSSGICPDCLDEFYAHEFQPGELEEIRAKVRQAWGKREE